MHSKNIEIVNKLIQKTSRYSELVEEALIKELRPYSNSKFYQPLRYSLDGGKRIRPMMLLLATDAVRGDMMKSMSAAVAIELLHTESIIHDDIIDEESSRREKSAFHIEYGISTSLLSADYVFGIILDLASGSSNGKITKELSTIALRMCEGEFTEIKINSEHPSITWEEYIEIISKKTAALFQGATKIGAIAGGGSEEEVKTLAEYGLYIGIAYQIQDDIIDWSNDQKIVRALVVDGESTRNHLSKMAFMYSSMAKKCLERLPDSQAKYMLIELAEFTVLRTN